ncbi:hypothetical protein Tco_0604547 [Tanacetum coccineum]
MMNINQDYPTSLRTSPYFDSNASGDGGLKGGLVSWFVKPRTPRTPILMVPNEVEFVYTAITKAGTKLLLHRAHFSCSWDTLGILTLKASAADT